MIHRCIDNLNRIVPLVIVTTSSQLFFNVFLMNRNKCFWFMHEAACIWVSTLLWNEKKKNWLEQRKYVNAVNGTLHTLTEYYKNPCVVQPSVKPALLAHWVTRATEISSTNNSADDSKTIFCQRDKFDNIILPILKLKLKLIFQDCVIGKLLKCTAISIWSELC